MTDVAPAATHAGHGRDRGEDLVEEGGLLRVRRIARRGKRQVEGQQMPGIEPGIDALQPGEALHQQPGAGEQRERERHLGHDQGRGGGPGRRGRRRCPARPP